MGKLLVIRNYKILNRTKCITERAINGDKKSIELLIEDNKDYLYKMAFLHLKDEQDTIEVCQETVYKAILNIHKLKNHNYFKTWITRILLNNINDLKRLNNRNPNNIESIETLEDISYEKLEEKIDLYNAIDLLDEKFRTPIIFQYFYDMTVKEISEVLECNENTIKTYISRGKKKLYKILMEGK